MRMMLSLQNYSFKVTSEWLLLQFQGSLEGDLQTHHHPSFPLQFLIKKQTATADTCLWQKQKFVLGLMYCWTPNFKDLCMVAVLDLQSNTTCQCWESFQYLYYAIIRFVHWYFFSEDKCLNSCKSLFAESQTEDCLELNFKNIDYETLAYRYHSSYVCWTSARANTVHCLLSVQVSTRLVPLAVCLTNKAR